MIYLDWVMIQDVLLDIFHSGLFWVLMACIVLDFITGTFKALLSTGVNSSTGTRGLVKHSVIFLLTIVIAIISKLVKLEPLGITFALFYIFEYTISIIENLDKLGVPFPDELRKYITSLRDEHEITISSEEQTEVSIKEDNDNDDV